jgi:biopolymer transport protein ExbB
MMDRSTGPGRTRKPHWRTRIALGMLLVVFLVCSSVVWNQATAQGQDVAPSDVPQNVNQPLNVGKIPSEPYGVWLALGNPFRYLFAATSVFVVWLTIERLVVLRYGRVIPRHFVKRFFEHLKEGNLDPKSAIKLCEENGSPIALVLANGLRKWGKSSVEVEQAIIDGGERQISQLRKHIRALNGAATISPLLGLLGTVMGMIKSFNDISQKAAMGKSEELAGGIGLSLLTTAAGLAIAIPSLVMYMYFTSRVDALVVEMDAKAQELVDYISAEALAEQARANAKTGATAKPEPRRAV